MRKVELLQSGTIRITTVKDLQLHAVHREFTIFCDDWVKARHGVARDWEFRKCFLCGHQFADGEIINLISIRNHTNEITCTSCTDAAEEVLNQTKEHNESI